MSPAKIKTVFLLLLAIISLAVSPLFVKCPQAVQAEEPDANESDVEYWAVIVDIWDYSMDFMDLGELDNAEDLYDRLAPLWGEDHIRVLVNDDATKENIEDAVCSWLYQNVDANDVAIFYYAGHGSVGTLWLQGYAAPGSSFVDIYHVYDYELKSWLGRLKSDTVVVILDTCKSASFIPALSRPGGVVLASCKADQMSYSYSVRRNGIFTYLLLTAFDYSEFVDSNADHIVSIEEMYAYANESMSDILINRNAFQNPQIDDRYDGELGLFYVAEIDISPDDAALLVDVDGALYSSRNLPMSFTWALNSTHNLSVRSNDAAWVSSSPINISQGGEYGLVYLDVESEYGDPQGEGWYVKGTTANVSVSSSHGVIVRDVFTGWDFDPEDADATTTVSMSGSKTVTALWRKDYSQLYMLVSGLVVVIAAGVFTLVRRRVKARKVELVLPWVEQDESITQQ